MIEDNLSVLEESLEAKRSELVDSRLVQFGSVEREICRCIRHSPPHTGGVLFLEHDTKNRISCLTPTSVPSTVSKPQSNCRCNNNNNNNQLCLNGHVGVETY